MDTDGCDHADRSDFDSYPYHIPVKQGKRAGERALLFNNVLVRANAAFALEMHVDLEEGNAAGVKNGDLVELVK